MRIRKAMQEGLRKALGKSAPNRVDLADQSTARWRAVLKPHSKDPVLHKGRVVYRLRGLEFTQNPGSFTTHILSIPSWCPKAPDWR